MKKQAVYRSLESKMLKYADLIDVSARPIREKLVSIETSSILTTKPINNDMQAYTGDLIFVRESVLAKLQQTANILAKANPELQLQVVYGYRALSVQQKLFLKYRKRLESTYSGEALDEATHRLIAVPEIAGHPTGGAVDIQITNAGVPIDMGTNIWEFVKDSFMFSPFIGQEAQDNRLLLRSIMMDVGFAPFDGEWWHFSYGDKEWAAYYKKPFAIYNQIEFKTES